jgi:hypothetical protein
MRSRPMIAVSCFRIDSDLDAEFAGGTACDKVVGMARAQFGKPIQALSGVWPAFVLLKSGLRFSRNAAKASFASADRTLAANSLSSRLTA